MSEGTDQSLACPWWSSGDDDVDESNLPYFPLTASRLGVELASTAGAPQCCPYRTRMDGSRF